MKAKKMLQPYAVAAVFLLCFAALSLLFLPRSSSGEIALIQEGRMSVRSFLAVENETGSSDPAPVPSGYPKGVSEALLNGFLECSAEIGLTDFSIDADQLRDAMQDLINSRPELFYVSGKYTYRHTLNTVVSIKPEYLFTGDELAGKQAEYEEMLNALLLRIDPAASEADKVLAVNDLLCLGFSYEEEPGVFDAYHFLKDGKGVCQSYTLTATALFNRLGIESVYVQSEAMNHIWNLVRVDGNWYHLDITWNDPTPDVFGKASHKNFLLNDADIAAARHYNWSIAGDIPAAETSYPVPFRQISCPVYSFGGCYYYLNDGEIARQDAENGEITFPFPIHEAEGLASNGEFLIVSSGNILYSVRVPEEEIIPLMAAAVPGGIWGMQGTVIFSDGSSVRISPSLPSTEYALHLYRDSVFLGTFSDAESAFSRIASDPHENAGFLLRTKLSGGLIPLSEETVLPENRNLVFADSTLSVFGAFETASSLTLARSVLYPGSADASFTVSGELRIDASSFTFSLPVSASRLSVFAPDGSVTINGSVTADELRTGGTVRLGAAVSAGLLDMDAGSVLVIGERGYLSVGSLTCPDLTVIPYSYDNLFHGFSLDASDSLGSLLIRLNSLPPLGPTVLPAEKNVSKDLLSGITFLWNDTDLTPLFSYDTEMNGLVRHLDTWLEVEGTRLIRCVSVSENCEAYVPEGVTSIADYAFSDVSGQLLIYLPDTVTDLGYFPFGFYRDESGEMLRSEAVEVFAPAGSVGASFALANGFSCHEYFSASVSGYTGVFFLEGNAVRLTGYPCSDGSTVIIPASFSLGSNEFSVVSLSEDLFGSAKSLKIFTHLDSSLVPSVWQESHTVNTGDRWHTLTVLIDGAVLAYPVPSGESPAKWLTAQEKPDRGNVRYLFRGYDTDGDGEPDDIPDVLEADMTAEAIFEKHDKDDSFNILFLLPDGTLFFSETVKAGEPIGTPGIPEWEDGAVFTGWCGYLPDMTVKEDTTFVAGFLTEENEALLTSPLLKIEDGYLFLGRAMTPEELFSCLEQKEGVVLGEHGVVTGETVRYRDVVLTVILQGDLNGDGSVSVTDYLILRSDLIGKRKSEGTMFSASDMNGDGRITVTDLLCVGAIILGKSA